MIRLLPGSMSERFTVTRIKFDPLALILSRIKKGRS